MVRATDSYRGIISLHWVRILPEHLFYVRVFLQPNFFCIWKSLFKQGCLLCNFITSSRLLLGSVCLCCEPQFKLDTGKAHYTQIKRLLLWTWALWPSPKRNTWGPRPQSSSARTPPSSPCSWLTTLSCLDQLLQPTKMEFSLSSFDVDLLDEFFKKKHSIDIRIFLIELREFLFLVVSKHWLSTRFIEIIRVRHLKISQKSLKNKSKLIFFVVSGATVQLD